MISLPGISSAFYGVATVVAYAVAIVAFIVLIRKLGVDSPTIYGGNIPISALVALIIIGPIYAASTIDSSKFMPIYIERFIVLCPIALLLATAFFFVYHLKIERISRWYWFYLIFIMMILIDASWITTTATVMTIQSNDGLIVLLGVIYILAYFAVPVIAFSMRKDLFSTW
jgi:hypothetical protein